MDPVLTVRVHPADDPASPTARRVVRTNRSSHPWLVLTAPSLDPRLSRTDAEVRAWPVQPLAEAQRAVTVEMEG
ncbi:hypothetical protein [Actinophytocola sediminis]